jgi:hypothetical protein
MERGRLDLITRASYGDCASSGSMPIRSLTAQGALSWAKMFPNPNRRDLLCSGPALLRSVLLGNLQPCFAKPVDQVPD